MKEMSVAEQRYKAVLAVIGDGRTVKEVARDWGVSRQTLHAWLARYEEAGLEGLVNRSFRPLQCPHQMPAEIEVKVLEMRRTKPFWGARRLVFEMARKGVQPLPSESAVYRSLVRAGLIDPVRRQRRLEHFKRWERAAPMDLWQMDVVGGFHLADGTTAKALTGLDDHSRHCVSARLMHRERTSKVCDGFNLALRRYGAPDQVLTDNGKVFTGRLFQPPVEVLFDRICRENGIEHILTQPRSPTTTGKIERFHKTLRIEFDTRQVFKNLETAQETLDEWVEYYNTQRPHRSLDDATPATRFKSSEPKGRQLQQSDDYWVSRKVASNGVVCIGYQQVSVGQQLAGSACNVLVKDGLLQFWVDRNLVRTVARETEGVIRKKHADGQAPRR